MDVERLDVLPVEGYDAQTGLLMGMLKAVTRKWRAELGDVSEEMLVWQAVPQGHNIGAIILHIADVEAYWLHQVATGWERTQEELDRLLSDATDQYGGKWPIPPTRPLSWYYEQHDAIRARTHALIQTLNNPEHSVQIERREFTLRWLLHHVMAHEAYHGGQAVLLASLYRQHNPASSEG